MRMSLAFRAVSCALAVIANYSGQNEGLEIWRNCNVTRIAFFFQILHINFGQSRWTDTIRCSNIGNLRSRIPTPGFICLYIVMSLQARMAAESIQDADLSFLSNYVHHSNRRGLSSFKWFAGEKSWSKCWNDSAYEHKSFMAPKLLQHNLLAAVSSLYLTELTGIFTIAPFFCIQEKSFALSVEFGISCALPSGFLLLTIYSICNLTDTSWGMFIIIFSYHYYRWTLFKIIVLSCTLLLPICILQGHTECLGISKSKLWKIRELH